MGFSIAIKLGRFVWNIKFFTDVTKEVHMSELEELVRAAAEEAQDSSLKDEDGNRIMGFQGGTS